MKLLSIAVALAAATSVNALAMEKWCYLPGQGCYMLKRAADASGEVKRNADALAEAMAEASPEAMEKWCYLPGQGCNKMKRTAEAVDEVKRAADALADAMTELDVEQ